MPTNPAFVGEWLARELTEVATDRREPVYVVENRRDRRRRAREKRAQRAAAARRGETWV